MATATAKQTETVEALAKRLANAGKTDLMQRIIRYSDALDARYESLYGVGPNALSVLEISDPQQRRDYLASRRALEMFALLRRLERSEGEPSGNELHGFLVESSWTVPQETKEAEHDVAVHPDR